MSRERLSAIAHADLPFAAPWSEATAAAVLDALELPAGDRVVDLGCGWAELLVRIVERYDAVGEGVELSPHAVRRARESTLPRAGGRVRIHEAAAADVDLPSSSYQLVVCVGSTHLYGGLAGTLDEARRLLAPGGRILLGDGAWGQPPTAAALAGLGADPDDLPAVDELIAAVRAAGFADRSTWESSPDEWDRYETSWCGSLERWAAEHPDDPDSAAATRLAADHRRGYADGYRGVLSFVTILAAT